MKKKIKTDKDYKSQDPKVIHIEKIRSVNPKAAGFYVRLKSQWDVNPNPRFSFLNQKNIGVLPPLLKIGEMCWRKLKMSLFHSCNLRETTS